MSGLLRLLCRRLSYLSAKFYPNRTSSFSRNLQKRMFLRSKLAVFESKLHPEDVELAQI